MRKIEPANSSHALGGTACAGRASCVGQTICSDRTERAGAGRFGRADVGRVGAGRVSRAGCFERADIGRVGRAGFSTLAALCLALSLCLMNGCSKEETAEKTQGESGFGALVNIVTSDDPLKATEGLVKGSIQEELVNLVFSQGWLDDVLTDIPVSELKKYGINSVSQLQSYIASLDYEIGNINFNGNSANVDITFEGRTVTLGVERVNGEWKLSNTSKAELVDLVLAN